MRRRTCNGGRTPVLRGSERGDCGSRRDEREVALVITTKRTGATLTVQGRLDLLMTDYGITPPKALMGMLKTDPKVTVTFETVLAIPLT